MMDSDSTRVLDFGDFLTTKYGYGDDYIEYRRKRLKNGAMHEEVEEVDEAWSKKKAKKKSSGKGLTPAQRQKLARNAKKNAKRMQMGKKRASRRAADMNTLMKRARRQAKNNLIKKWTRGKSKSELSFGQRAEMEKKLAKAKGKIERNAKKLLKDVRKADRERLAKGKDLKKRDSRVSSVKKAAKVISQGVGE